MHVIILLILILVQSSNSFSFDMMTCTPAHDSLAMKITYSTKYPRIGSSFNITCSSNDSKLEFGFIEDKRRIVPFDDAFVVSKTKNSVTAELKRVPESYYATRRFLMCIAIDKENQTHCDTEKIYFGKKPQNVEALECNGLNAMNLKCHISRPSVKPYHKGIINNDISASITLVDKEKSKIHCIKRDEIGTTEARCVYVISENVLTIKHPMSDFTKIVGIKLEYCNVFGCSTYTKSFNRSSVETPNKMCLTNTTSMLGEFSYAISKSMKVYGSLDKYCLTCKTDVETKEICRRKQSGKMENLLSGAEYQCSLKVLFPFSPKWSEACEHTINTIGKEPSTGPTYCDGMFSLENKSNVRIYYSPPALEHRNGRIIEYGLSYSDSPNIESTSSINMIQTSRSRGLFYLFARNSYGWSKNGTKVVIPPDDEILTAPLLELWKISRDTYEPNIEFPSGISNKKIANVIYVICDHKVVHCRTDVASNRSITASLAHEKVAVVIQTSDNRWSSITPWGWIRHYCWKGGSARVKEKWIAADLIHGKTIQVKVSSSHLQCSPDSRRPVPMLNFSYVCGNSSQEHLLRRSGDRDSFLSIKFKSKSCRLLVKQNGETFRIPLHESLTSLSQRSPSSNQLTIIIVVLSPVGLIFLVMCGIFMYKKCKRPCSRYQQSKKMPVWSKDISRDSTDVYYQTQGVEDTTEMTSLTSSKKPASKEESTETINNSLLSKQDSNVSQPQYIT